MSWWYRFWHRGNLDEQLDKELKFHLEQHATDLMVRGLDPEEAYRQARLALGGPEQLKEECRDARGTRWMEDLGQDLRFAVRTMGQRPGFAALAILTLALGSGATTVMFTIIDGVLLKPLSYPAPDRLVRLHEQTNWSTQYGNQWAFTNPNYLDCKRECRSLLMAAWRYSGGTVTAPGEADYLSAGEVSSEIFSVLGISPVAGRNFRPDDDRPGATPVAIVSYGLSQRRFGGNSEAIGRPLIYDGKSYIVVGIAPPGFRLDGEEVDVLTPLGQDTSPGMQNREAHRLRVGARLGPGVKLAQAQTELALIARNLEQHYPKSNKGRSFVAEPLRLDVGNVESTLWLLLGAVTLVLLIACVNVASLLLARAVSRERELATRVALGAGRGRLVRQCLTESALLGVSGGVLGVVLARLGLRPFLLLWPGTLPRAEDVQLDWQVLLATLGVSLLTGLLFGLAPAMRAPARDLEKTLRAGGRTVAGNSRGLHSRFVICEIALAVVLLVSAGVLGRTLLRLSSLDPGLDIHNVLVTRMAITPTALGNPASIRATWQDVQDRIRRVPGVQSVALVDTVPMRQGNNQLGYWTSAAVPPPNEMPLALATTGTPDYMKVMGLRLREGRFFSEQDRAGSDPVVVIDDVLGQRAFPGAEPVGKRLWIPNMGPGPFRIVGVVRHVRHWGLASDDQAQVRAQFYYPFAQVPDALMRRWSELMSVAVRTSIAPLSILEALRRQVSGAAGDQVLYEIRTLEQLASDTLSRQRFLVMLFGIFAGLALLLACIGIYGVLAYVTSQRVPEIGVRMALGASALDVIRLVMRQSIGMIFAGAGIGIAVSLAAARVLERLVDGVRSTEPWTIAAMVSVLVAAALLASFVPARRASRVDPLRALRQE